jgi:hypothetical protein
MTNKKYSGQCIHGIPSCDGDSKERSVGDILEVAGVTDEYFRIDVKQLKIENNPIIN